MKILLITTVAVFALGAPLASQAKDHHGHPKGHAARAKGHAPTHAGAWTPPGLAKKPHGMPPGQAKKIWGRGDSLPSDYVADRYAVAYPTQHNLGPAPYGSRWVRVDDNYYLAQTRTGMISQVISALVK